MIQKPTFEELLSRAWNNVSNATGLTASSESGIAINILKVFTQELLNLWDSMEYIESQGLLSTATGINLDKIGQFFGVVRRSASASTTIGGPSSVKFTNNGGTTAIIPANTRVWPSEDPTIAYFTVISISIPAGGQAYSDVRAATSGQFFNVGANKLVNHSVGDSSITVTNELPITNGTDIESDNNYRIRIQNEVLRRESSNPTAIREALLEVPGVRDVQINNLARGTGTLDVLIYGYDNIVPQAIIDTCQSVLDLNVAAGISALALAPVTSFVDVTVKLRLKTSAILSTIKTTVSAAIAGYINNLPIEDGSGNGTLIFQELAARVQESSPDIIDSDVQLLVNDLPTLKSNQLAEVGSRFIARVIAIT